MFVNAGTAEFRPELSNRFKFKRLVNSPNQSLSNFRVDKYAARCAGGVSASNDVLDGSVLNRKRGQL